MNGVLKRQEIWRLTVNWYPHVAAEGARPIIARSYGDERIPGEYRPHEFRFDNPPSREDFKAVVRQLPWASHAWKDDLLPLSDKFAWPFIEAGKKGATVELENEQGQTVGHLEVWKDEIWENESYPRNIHIGYDLVERLIRGYKGEAREELRRHIDAQELRIIEAIVNQSKANGGVWPGGEPIEAEVKKVIAAWKKDRKAKQKGEPAHA